MAAGLVGYVVAHWLALGAGAAAGQVASKVGAKVRGEYVSAKNDAKQLSADVAAMKAKLGLK